MRILVAAKAVIDIELNVRISNGLISEDDLQYVLNPWDEIAIEAAIRMKEKYGAEITIVSVGGENSVTALRKGLAMGADHAVHIEAPHTTVGEYNLIVTLLKKFIEQKESEFDLVLAGKQSQDTDNGIVGAVLAEKTCLPFVTNTTNISLIDEKQIAVTRIGDEGIEEYEVDLPALVTVSDSMNSPRHLSVKNILKAQRMEIKTYNSDLLNLDQNNPNEVSPKINVIEYAIPSSKRLTRKFEGDPEEITIKAVELLVKETNVI